MPLYALPYRTVKGAGCFIVSARNSNEAQASASETLAAKADGFAWYGGAHKVIGNVFNIEYTEPKPPNYQGIDLRK